MENGWSKITDGYHEEVAVIKGRNGSHLGQGGDGGHGGDKELRAYEKDRCTDHADILDARDEGRVGRSRMAFSLLGSEDRCYFGGDISVIFDL